MEEEEREYLRESAEPEEEPVNLETTRKLMEEKTRAALFEKIITPDMHEQIKYFMADKTEVTPFTKELRTSFLNPPAIEMVEELSDISKALFKVGAENTCLTLLQHRDTILSVATSNKALLLRLMQTEYKFQKLDTGSKKKDFFKRGGEEQ
ncbi:MAG: hypothetical protein JSW41_02110 [Candidatus Aenigmatarchaeota archaeon]|nr:MAG: hypothetical protein JSW41_02110 [Candidatus Aenigmarchaeota archaeon]